MQSILPEILRQIVVGRERSGRPRGLVDQVVLVVLRLGASFNRAGVVLTSLISRLVPSIEGHLQVVVIRDFSRVSLLWVPFQHRVHHMLLQPRVLRPSASASHSGTRGSHQFPYPASGSCFGCGEFGHMKRHCPRLRGSQYQQRGQSSSSAPFTSAPTQSARGEGQVARGEGQVARGRPRGGGRSAGGQAQFYAIPHGLILTHVKS